ETARSIEPVKRRIGPRDPLRAKRLCFMDPMTLFGVAPALAQGVEVSGLGGPGESVSLLGLFLQAGLVVKLVMVGLLLASIWSWAIIFDKWLLFTRTRRQLDRFEKVFWSGQSLEELYR